MSGVRIFTIDDVQEYEFPYPDWWKRMSKDPFEVREDRDGTWFVTSPYTPTFAESGLSYFLCGFPGPFDSEETATVWLVWKRLTDE